MTEKQQRCIGLMIVIALSAFWLIQSNASLVESGPRHCSIQDIEALGFGLKFAGEQTISDGRHIWLFSWGLSPIRAKLVIPANPTEAQVLASIAAYIHEVLYLDGLHKKAAPSPSPQ